MVNDILNDDGSINTTHPMCFNCCWVIENYDGSLYCIRQKADPCDYGVCEFFELIVE